MGKQKFGNLEGAKCYLKGVSKKELGHRSFSMKPASEGGGFPTSTALGLHQSFNIRTEKGGL